MVIITTDNSRHKGRAILASCKRHPNLKCQKKLQDLQSHHSLSQHLNSVCTKQNSISSVALPSLLASDKQALICPRQEANKTCARRTICHISQQDYNVSSLKAELGFMGGVFSASYGQQTNLIWAVLAYKEEFKSRMPSLQQSNITFDFHLHTCCSTEFA